jgi:antirestriction protein ArdC
MTDLYTTVTNRIITALEHGTPPWICPWRKDTSSVPRNLVSGKPYRGVNFITLSIEAMAATYSDSRWLTFRQANQLGAHIRKGEHGVQIVFYKLHERGDHASGSTDSDPANCHDTKRVIPLLKSYTVFNASQVEGLPERCQLLLTPPLWQPLDAAEMLLSASGAVIQHGGNRAFYRPADDTIQLPPKEAFSMPSAYYGTALHELCHWTGHSSRLNRVLSSRHQIEAYAYEELVAEIGAAFLCAHSGLEARLEHASYVDHWLDALRRDKRLIFVAAGAAQKAADFVLQMAGPEKVAVDEDVVAEVATTEDCGVAA